MKHHAVFFAIGVFFGSSITQTGQNIQPPLPAAGSIEGTVTRAGGAQPLRGTRISLARIQNNGEPEPSRLATPVMTDNAGHFRITGIAPGQYKVTAEREGFIRQEYGQRSLTSKGLPVSIDNGQRLTIDFQMSPGAVIAGRVLDEQGEPLAGLGVMAQTYQYINGKRTLEYLPQGPPQSPEGPVFTVRSTTNDLGEYRLYWLPPGDYYISVAPRSQMMTSSALDLVTQRANESAMVRAGVFGTSMESYSAIYFPGVPDAEAAAPVKVTSAVEIRGVDFTWRPIRLASVRGRVAAPPPAQDISVAGRRIQGEGVSIQLTRVDGRGRVVGTGQGGRSSGDPTGNNVQLFEIRGIQPGAYYVNGLVRRDNAFYFGRTRIEVGSADINDVAFGLQPSINVPGKVVFESTPPQSFSLTQLLVNATPIDQSVGIFVGATRIAEDGTFTLKNIAPVEYRLAISNLPEGSYLSAAYAGAVDLSTAAFPEADKAAPLELRIGFSVGRASGIVRRQDGALAAGSTVALIPDESRRQRRDFYFTTSSDLNGTFAFNNVPEGNYTLFAWDEIPSGAYQSPEFIGRFEGRGSTIRIENGTTVNTQLNLITDN